MNEKIIDDSTETLPEAVEEESIPLKFKAYTKTANTRNSVVRLVMDLDVDMDRNLNFLEAMAESEINVEFPEGLTLKDVTLRSVEVRK
jgi:hypothetical protein